MHITKYNPVEKWRIGLNIEVGRTFVFYELDFAGPIIKKVMITRISGKKGFIPSVYGKDVENGEAFFTPTPSNAISMEEFQKNPKIVNDIWKDWLEKELNYCENTSVSSMSSYSLI